MLKNKTLTLVFLLIGISANAQTNTTEIGKGSFGIFAGVNLQNINGKDASGDQLSNDLVTRFNFGVNYEIPIAPEFYIQPGLQFISKGTKGPVMYTNNTGTTTVTRELKLNYLEMPVNFIFKPLLGTGHLFLGFGPYFSYGISGKALFKGSSEPSDTEIQFGKTSPESDRNNLIYFKRMDIGANFLVGYELSNGLNLCLNTQLGLININSESSDKTQNKNTGFGLVLGYRF